MWSNGRREQSIGGDVQAQTEKRNSRSQEDSYTPVIDAVEAIGALQKKFAKKLAERDARGEPAWLGMVLAYGYAMEDRLYLVDEDALTAGLSDDPYVVAARSMRLRLPVSKELRAEMHEKMVAFGSNPWFPKRVRTRGFRSPPPDGGTTLHSAETPSDDQDAWDTHAAPHG